MITGRDKGSPTYGFNALGNTDSYGTPRFLTETELREMARQRVIADGCVRERMQRRTTATSDDLADWLASFRD